VPQARLVEFLRVFAANALFIMSAKTRSVLRMTQRNLAQFQNCTPRRSLTSNMECRTTLLLGRRSNHFPARLGTALSRVRQELL
jgi:hypothetical protein